MTTVIGFNQEKTNQERLEDWNTLLLLRNKKESSKGNTRKYKRFTNAYNWYLNYYSKVA